MAEMCFRLDEKTVDALQKIAEMEHTSVEALVERLIAAYIEQNQRHERKPDDLKWLLEGQFSSGYTDTGRNADEIINGEYQPTRATASKWASVGLFSTGASETGRNADEILNGDREAD